MEEARGRYWTSTLVLIAAGVMLAISFWLPYWNLTLVTPGKPQGARLVSYLNHLDGPESVLLNGGGAGKAGLQSGIRELELSFAVALVTAFCLLGLAAVLVRNRWAALLALPPLCFPLIVVADTTRWLVSVVAVLSGTDDLLRSPPTFLLSDRLVAGGVALEIRPDAGLLLAIASSITVLVGVWLHRKAHRLAAVESTEGKVRFSPMSFPSGKV